MIMGLLGLMFVGTIAKVGLKTTETMFKIPGKCTGKC
jgi:hypothetical protein